MSVPQSSETHVTETLVDLLASYSGWTNSAPKVFKHHDRSFNQKVNENDPSLYVWTTQGDFRPIGAEADTYYWETPFEIAIWTLNEVETLTYRDDTLDFLTNYARDRTRNTTFHQINPLRTDDQRREHIRETTNHYVASVSGEANKERDAA